MSELAAILEKMKNNTPLDAADVPAGTPAPSPPPSIPIAKLQAYLTKEVDMLEKRQQAAQEAIEAKAKELQGLRENMLVISGALQGVQHIKAYLDQQQPHEPVTTPTPSTPLTKSKSPMDPK